MKLPLNIIVNRGDDPTGHGCFGAKRGEKKHKGLDLLAKPGTEVFSMIHGKVTKIGYCYKDALEFRYVEVSNDTYRIRLLYTGPINLKKGDSVSAGDKVGVVQDVAGHWANGMLNHLHVEIYKNGLLTDPEPLIALMLLKERPEEFNYWDEILKG